MSHLVLHVRLAVLFSHMRYQTNTHKGSDWPAPGRWSRDWGLCERRRRRLRQPATLEYKHLVVICSGPVRVNTPE